MTTVFGGNYFVGGTVVPLAMNDRYVFIEPSGTAQPLVTVVRDVGGTPVFEVLRNEPGEGEGFSASKSAVGIVAVSDASEGFEYKVRPDSETSVVFGRLKGDKIEARITDDAISVGGVRLERNMFMGPQVGVRVDKAGGIAIGGSIPDSLQKLLPPTT